MVTNNEETNPCSSERKLHDGLNVSHVTFAEYIKSNDELYKGRGVDWFRITNFENVPLFYGHGRWLRIVELPKKTKYPEEFKRFSIVKECSGIVWITNMIELDENKRYDLLNPDTVKLFKLPISEYFVDYASSIGDVKNLENWKESGLEFKYSTNAINSASANGHIEVLEWWKKSGFPLKYTCQAIHSASNNGEFKSLEWWKKSGLKLLYQDSLIDFSSSVGNIAALNWWKGSGLPILYSASAIDNASMHGEISVLEWWKNSGLPLKYSKYAIDGSSVLGLIDVLEWWKKSGLKVIYNVPGKGIAKKIFDKKVFEWFKDFEGQKSAKRNCPCS